jgi:hypothetical protein
MKARQHSIALRGWSRFPRKPTELLGMAIAYVDEHVRLHLATREECRINSGIVEAAHRSPFLT